jgi:hypothetical protein
VTPRLGLSGRRQRLREAAAGPAAASFLELAAWEQLSTTDEYDRFIRILRTHDSLLLEWGALPPPRGDNDLVDEILNGFRAGNREAFEAAEAYEAGDDGRYQAARTRAENHDAAAGQRASAYGLRVCSQLGS